MEAKISSAIISTFTDKLKENLDIDVAIVGGGPSGLVASYYLAKAGKKVSIFEEKLHVGGGIWAGGMMFNQIVVQKEITKYLDEFSVNYKDYDDDMVTLDSVELAASLVYHARHEGAVIFNNMKVEDVIFKNNRVAGVVINWNPVDLLRMHVDPLMVLSKAVVDATGHHAIITSGVQRKAGIQLETPSGKIENEKPMWAEEGERLTVEHTKKIYPGLYVSGMAATGVGGSFRMGPIFGGMMLSGERLANTLINDLG